MCFSRKLRVGFFAAALAGLLAPLVWAHPAIEGGLKHGFHGVKDVVGAHIELVADQRTISVRVYIAEAQDEKLSTGKNHEWGLSADHGTNLHQKLLSR